MPKTRHRISGAIDIDTPQHIIDHPVLGKYLEVVDERAKPIPSELVSRSKAETIASESKTANKTTKKDDE
jgi:hypothetical protein